MYFPNIMEEVRKRNEGMTKMLERRLSGFDNEEKKKIIEIDRAKKMMMSHFEKKIQRICKSNGGEIKRVVTPFVGTAPVEKVDNFGQYLTESRIIHANGLSPRGSTTGSIDSKMLPARNMSSSASPPKEENGVSVTPIRLTRGMSKSSSEGNINFHLTCEQKPLPSIKEQGKFKNSYPRGELPSLTENSPVNMHGKRHTLRRGSDSVIERKVGKSKVNRTPTPCTWPSMKSSNSANKPINEVASWNTQPRNNNTFNNNSNNNNRRHSPSGLDDTIDTDEEDPDQNVGVETDKISRFLDSIEPYAYSGGMPDPSEYYRNALLTERRSSNSSIIEPPEISNERRGSNSNGITPYKPHRGLSHSVSLPSIKVIGN